MSFQATPVWQQVTPELEGELVAFWTRNHVLADGERAQQRAAQAVCIGRDPEGTLCAVGTAVLRVLPRLRQPTYYYRQCFDVSQRGQGQTLAFANRARDILQAYNASLPRPESLGMLVEVENALLAGRYDQAIEPVTGYSFIGYSPRGLVLRVSWFEGATLLPLAGPPRFLPVQPHKNQPHKNQPQKNKSITGIPA
jgi:hypothetical protein